VAVVSKAENADACACTDRELRARARLVGNSFDLCLYLYGATTILAVPRRFLAIVLPPRLLTLTIRGRHATLARFDVTLHLWAFHAPTALLSPSNARSRRRSARKTPPDPRTLTG